MPRFRVELDGFQTVEYEAENRELAWDRYKHEFGQAVRRLNHDKTPVVTEVEAEPAE